MQNMKLFRLITTAVVLSFLAVNPLSSQTTVLIEATPDNVKDAPTFSLPCSSSYAQLGGHCTTRNYGDVGYFMVTSWTYNGTLGTRRCFMEFDLSEYENQGCQVTKATLTMQPSQLHASHYHCGTGSTLHSCGDNSIKVSRITEAWDESVINWDNQPAVVENNYGSDFVSISNEPQPYVPYEIDITGMVNYWLANPGSNKGMRFAFVNEGSYRSVAFGSSDHPDLTKRPKLLLEMSCNAGEANVISGQVYQDVDSDCNYSESLDHGMEGWMVKTEPGSFIGFTDSDGNYSISVLPTTGSYNVSLINPNDKLWQSHCSEGGAYTIDDNIVNNGGANDLDFPISASSFCPDLEVNIGTGFLRKGHISPFYVNYCNNGNIVADSTYINISIDDKLSINTSSVPYTDNGDHIRVDIGDLEPGECGSFYFHVLVAIEADLGETQCVKAEFLPHFDCTEVQDSSWDKSSVVVNGTCVDDTLSCFSVTNTGDSGDGDMQGTTEYRVFENSILIETGEVQLLGGETQSFCYPANGNTIRMEVDQRPGHPGNSQPNAIVEGCGFYGIGDNALSTFDDMPLDDQDPIIDIDCHEIITSFDPNDKAVWPSGVGLHKITLKNVPLEYRIRFQNTGNDTAFNIVILDTISDYLEPQSIRNMNASHPYKFSIQGNVYRWEFNNILLPDSNVNEPLSHGFIKFTIDQVENNPIATRIENSAAIYFDFNEPVITNKTLNSIGVLPKKKVVVDGIYEDLDTSDWIQVYPNPVSGPITVNIAKELWISSGMQLMILDNTGREIKRLNLQNHHSQFDLSSLQKGMYHYRVQGDSKIVGYGTLILN